MGKNLFNQYRLGSTLGQVCGMSHGLVFASGGTDNRGDPEVNKNDLVASVAEAASLSKSDAGRAVDTVFDSITDALQNGSDVRIVGFGSFTVAERRATTGRNPRTGEEVQVPASRVPKFKAGKALKTAVQASS